MELFWHLFWELLWNLFLAIHWSDTGSHCGNYGWGILGAAFVIMFARSDYPFELFGVTLGITSGFVFGAIDVLIHIQT